MCWSRGVPCSAATIDCMTGKYFSKYAYTYRQFRNMPLRFHGISPFSDLVASGHWWFWWLDFKINCLAVNFCDYLKPQTQPLTTIKFFGLQDLWEFSLQFVWSFGRKLVVKYIVTVFHLNHTQRFWSHVNGDVFISGWVKLVKCFLYQQFPYLRSNAMSTEK